MTDQAPLLIWGGALILFIVLFNAAVWLPHHWYGDDDD